MAIAFMFAKGLGLQGGNGTGGVSTVARCSCCSIWREQEEKGRSGGDNRWEHEVGGKKGV